MFTRSSTRIAMRVRLAAAVFAVAAPVIVVAPTQTFAQEAADAPSDALNKTVSDFWHYGKIARYDLAANKAQEILANGDATKVLTAFEKVAEDRDDDLDEWMIRWRGTDALKEPADALFKLIDKGRRQRNGDPAYITKNIERLANGDRPYRLAMVQLRESGELAVPYLLNVLFDPEKKLSHGVARQAILDLGRMAINPLVAATESDRPDDAAIVVDLLGALGYDAALPYVRRVAEKGESQALKDSATFALTKLAGRGNSTAADEFYDLSEKLYYGRSSLNADVRFPTANVWRWEGGGKGLVRTPVPKQIFNDIMSMRAAEYAMVLGTQQDALSLWLAANYRREADIPQGEKDATRAENQPPAHFYGVTAGTSYLNATLARALRDGNNAVALAAVKSLQEIVGDSNFQSGSDSTPLIRAMDYSDRRVRFEAAFTLAAALPQSAFAGQESVVPLLAEAISQTGQPSVLVVMPSQEAVNGIVEPLKSSSYITAGATNATGALSAAAALPAIDVVIISEELPPNEIESLMGMISQSPKIRGASKLFVVRSSASDWATRAATDSSISTTTATAGAELTTAITAARTASGALPLDPQMATDYATRAGELLKRLAISRGQVFELAPARSTLLGALDDTRPAIVKLAGEALALLKDDDAQRGLLTKATGEGTADDVRMSLFKSLATSAKFFGNKLDTSNVEVLDRAVRESTNPEVKAAAAEARGALDLPNDQAKVLILDQSKR